MYFQVIGTISISYEKKLQTISKLYEPIIVLTQILVELFFRKVKKKIWVQPTNKGNIRIHMVK